MAANYDPQLNSLNREADRYQSELGSSPTATSEDAAPTYSDLSNQAGLKQVQAKIQQVQNTKLKDEWYGNDTTPTDTGDSGVHPGIISTALNALSQPLYGVVGAVEGATGQGLKKGVIQSALANMGEGHDDFSTLLKKNNVPYLLSAPLGFALDVGFDPVNWATAGTAATIPRAVYGLAKGGVEAGAKGAAYNAVSLGAKAMGLIPGLASSDARTAVADTAKGFAEDYDRLTGRDIMQNAMQPGMVGGAIGQVSPYRQRVGSMIQSSMSQIPGGDKLFDAFNYNNADYIKYSKWQDTLKRAHGVDIPPDATPEQIAALVKQTPISPDVGDEATQFDMKNVGNFQSTLPLHGIQDPAMRGDIAARAEKLADDTNFISQNPDAIRNSDPEEMTQRFAEEVAANQDDVDQFQKMAQEYQRTEGKTGIKAYDDAVEWAKGAKLKNVAVGNDVMNGLASFIEGFKRSKLGLSPSTFMANAASGIPLWMMSGGSFEPGMVADFYKNMRFLGGKGSGKMVLNDLYNTLDNGASWIKYMRQYPDTFARVYGESPSYFVGKGIIDKMVDTGKSQGLIDASNEKDVVDQMEQYMRSLADEVDAQKQTATNGGLMDIVKKAKRPSAMTPEQTAARMADEGTVNPETVAMTGAEFNNSNWLRDKLHTLGEQAADPNAPTALKVLDAFLNKSMGVYGRVDQAWRWTFAKKMSMTGLTEPELKRMSNMYQFKPGDIIGKTTDKNGAARFMLSPDKATEISADILFNYAAMPAAVRMLRSVPVLGSPFASFMYGMAMRTGQTLAYNPGAFNRVNFALQSAAGQKSPLEKKALQGPYYNWYNTPSMVRLPFFDQNPLYLNMANMIPYYSMNIFDPPGRKYQELLPNEITQAVDHSPFLKDPIGQMLFDYFIMPSMLKNEQPLNSFGQPLYPSDATTLQKVGYGARAAADTVTPNLAGLAGLITPETLAQYAPGYRWRQLSEAAAGKNQLGISTQEPASSRVLRGLAGLGGLPIQPLNEDSVVSDLKK